MLTLGYPTVTITHATEDGVTLGEFCSRLKVNFHRQSGEKVDLKEVYPKLQRTFVAERITMVPDPNAVLRGEFCQTCRSCQTLVSYPSVCFVP